MPTETSAQQTSATERFAGLPEDQLIRAFRLMHTSRRLDDREVTLKRQNRIYFQISGAGHEAVQVAAGVVLRSAHDWFYPYYRDRALCLTLGVTPHEMLQQAVGAAADPASGGRQMPSHWGRREYNIVSSSSPTGTQFLQAVGCAEASRYRNAQTDEVTLVCGGEGSTSEGEFWEAVNVSCTRHVPVLFLVEDNGYAISVPVEVETAGGDISRIVRAFPGLHVESVDGTDFFASLRAMRAAADYVRARKGPALVHAHVTRPYSHSLSDDEKLYKTAAEREAEARRDPIQRLAEFLKTNDLATAADLAAIDADLDREIDRAAQEALKAPKPARSTASDFVYSPTVDPASAAFDTPARHDGKPGTMVDAINRTLKDEMAHNPRVVVFGEDVADASRKDALKEVSGKGGVFKVTHGLQRTYGEDRVFNTPIAEASIIGRAVGMATRGLKPIVEIQFFDYIWPAMMQIRDEMSMMRYRTGNHWSCPMVIRVPIGGYLRGGGPYHSQSGESIFAHCPGIRIAYPCNAVDASGLLRTSIRCDDPVLFLEHKHLYRQTYNKGPYPGSDFMIPFGKGSLRREGSDLVVITWGALVQRSILAAQQAAERDGIQAAVLDLRTLMPFDWDAISTLVKQTNRVVIAHEDTLTCGFGAEVAAFVADACFEYLDAPVWRLAATDTPVAYEPTLENAILPQIADIVRDLGALLAY